MTPESHTVASNAFQPQRADPLPFAIKLLICFLFLQGLEAVVELSLYLYQSNAQAFTSSNPYKPEVFQHLVWIVACPLFAVLFYWRSVFGRILTQFLFAIHFVFIAQRIAVTSPEIWAYLTEVGRLRMVVTMALDLTVFLYLFTPQARRTLDQ